MSQALWQENASQNLSSILSVNASIPRLSSATPSPHKLSSGAVAGIVVGAVILCLLCVGAGIFYFWRRRKRDKASSDLDQTGPTVEVGDTSISKPTELQGDTEGPGELIGDGDYYGSDKKPGGAEVEGSPAPTDRAEVQGTPGGVEMDGSRGGVEMEGSPLTEMDGSGQQKIYEMPANEHLGPRTPRSASNRRGENNQPKSRWSWRRNRDEGP